MIIIKFIDNILRICLFACIFLASSALSIADIPMIADSCYSPMQASIYYATREPDRGNLRVTLWEYWGEYGIYIEEIFYEPYEGLPCIRSSYQFLCEDIEHALGIEYIYGLEFICWIDSITCEIEYAPDKSFTIQRVGKGEFLFGFD